MVKPQLPDLVVTSAVQIQRAVLLEAWIRFSVHIKIRGSREGAFVGIEIYDNTALDEEIDADRCTTPTLQEVVSKSYQNNPHQLHSLPHMGVALAMHRFRAIVLVHTAVALLANQISANEAYRRI